MKSWAGTLYGGSHWSRIIKNTGYYFRPGLTYTYMARGSMGARMMADSIFDVRGMSVFPRAEDELPGIAALLCSRLCSALLRNIVPSLVFDAGYVSQTPLPTDGNVGGFAQIGRMCIDLKRRYVAQDPLEHSFVSLPQEAAGAKSLLSACNSAESDVQGLLALLHTLEGLNDARVCSAYHLAEEDVRAVVEETGTPAGWYPRAPGYHSVPPSAAGLVPSDLKVDLEFDSSHAVEASQLARLKANLQVIYKAGPGAEVALDSGEDEQDIEGDGATPGGHIPIPAETFLEELSQRLEIHPISVYWLLKDLREQEGLVSPPELKRQMEDYVSVNILRLLGYRWPEQDAYEKVHGPILDPALVDADGIIPLVPCADQPTAAQRVRQRLERDFGEQGAEQSEREFRQWVGRSIDEWLRRDFFKRHVQQFKQRPIAWHLVSPERTFEAFVFYHRLSRATLQKLRAQYAGALIARLRAEQERARQRQDAAEVSRLQLQIEDVEEFRARLEKVERGDELKYRIRCRWKGETENGRPGPYNPDIDDGVKVNIRPFQEAGLLAVREVIKKW